MDNSILRSRLIDSNIKFSEVPEINLDLIRRDENFNMARQKKINTDTVAIYRTCLENGDVFPAIVLMAEKEKYIILDGNHRIEAARQMRMISWLYSAFILEGITESEAREFAYQANTEHGLPAAMEDRTAQAMYLVTKNGMTIMDAAKRTKAPYAIVKNRIRESEAKARLLKLNVYQETKNISNTGILSLNAIVDDDVFSQATLIAAKEKMSTVDCENLSRKIREFPSTRDQLDHLSEIKKNNSIIKKATAGADEKVKNIMKRINQAETLILSISKDDAACIPPELKGEFLKRVIELKNSANTLYGIMK